MRTTAGSSLLAALAAALLIPASAGAALPSDTVAAVGLQPIARTTFDHWFRIAATGEASQRSRHLQLVLPRPPRFTACIRALPHSLPASRRRKRCAVEYAGLRDQTLQFLISAEWLDAESALQGIAVTDEEVDRAFESNCRSAFPKASDFRTFLRETGMSVGDLRMRVRVQALSEKLRSRATAGAVPATEEDIAAYYAAHRDRFREPRSRDLRVVFTKTLSHARRTLASLRSGASWSHVHGRRLRGFAGGNGHAFDRAVFAAPLHRVRGPVRSRRGYAVFEVTGEHPAHVIPLAGAGGTIRRLLESQRRQSLLQDFVVGFQRRWRALTVCAKGFVVRDCGAVAR